MLVSGKQQAPKFRKLRASDVRPALLKAGVTLLSKRSADAVTIDDIVKTAKVAKGSFYYHFDNRAAFASEVLSLIRDDVDQQVEKVNLDVEDPVRRLTRGVCSSFQFAYRHPKKAKILIRVNANSSHIENPINAGLLSDLNHGADKGIFKITNMDAALLNVLGIASTILQQILIKEQPIEEIRELSRDSMYLMLRGFDVAHDAASKAAKEEVWAVLTG